MLKVTPTINLFVTKPRQSFAIKPQLVPVFKADLLKLKPAIDTFEKSTKLITIDEVKSLFPTGKLDENNYVIRAMKDVLSRIEPKPKKIIDLSPELTEEDYKLITDMMNLHNGKYIDIWKGYSDTDLIPNIEKLALFNRSMRLSKQADDFLQFNPDQWDIVVDGIVRKPKDAIIPLLEYKVNSDEINKALSTGEITPEIQKKIDAIENYINLFETKKDLTVYRGEGGYGILNSVNLGESYLGDVLEKFTNNISLMNEDLINSFIENFIIATIVNQPRFMSTAMTQKATEKYADKILWEIKVPAGTKGVSIESFNIERDGEAEFLIQRCSKLKIINSKYNNSKNIWKIETVLEQDGRIDNPLKNVKIETGV